MLIEYTVAFLASLAVSWVITETASWLLRRHAVSDQPEEVSTFALIDENLMRDEDKEMIIRSQEVLRAQLNEKPIESILNMDAKERVDTIEPLLLELMRVYGLPEHPPLKIKITNEKSSFCGYFSGSTNEIMLNVSFLLTNDPAYIREFLDTVFHELRHAVQHQMIKQPRFWGADQNLRAQLAYGLNPKNYISAKKNPKQYAEQLVERDAFTFAFYVMEGVCNEK